jgi:hypothetical protein
VVFEIYFVVSYFEVFEEQNKALIEVVDTIDFADFDKYYQISNDINLLIINSNVFIVELIVSLNLNVQLEMLFAICAITSAIFQGFVNRQEGFRHNRGTRPFEISSRTGTQK